MKKKLFMHVCSAQDAENAYEQLKKEYSFGLYFYNPNIQSRELYLEYADHVHQFAKRKQIKEFSAPYDPLRLRHTIDSWEKTELLQSRCAVCLYDRLQQTARIARINGFDTISTSIQSLGNLSKPAFKKILKSVAQEHNLKSLNVKIEKSSHSAVSPCSICGYLQNNKV